MISEIKSAIAYKLKDLFPKCKRYADNVPQNFTQPSFLINLIDQDYGKRIGYKFKSRISFDVAYFSDKPSAEIKSDCHCIQETLLREFDTIGKFRPLNKQASTVDDVLHITFDIVYSEMINKTENKMRESETNTNLKE